MSLGKSFRSVLALTGLLIAAGTGCSKQTRVVVVQLPSNFTGQIRVEMGVAGAPALPREGGQYVIHVPPDGKVATSTVIVEGEARIENVPPGRVWGFDKSLTKTGDGVPVGGSIEFFVGTQEQYKSSEAHRNKSSVAPSHDHETPDSYLGG